jgi:hypothetical protein
MITIPNATYIDGMLGITGMLMSAFAVPTDGQWVDSPRRKKIEEVLNGYLSKANLKLATETWRENGDVNYRIAVISFTEETITDAVMSYPEGSKDPFKEMKVTDNLSEAKLYEWFKRHSGTEI